jgi:sugar O-acyltransferase (sialic acid O-acetyltransferase NeuD family)
MKRLFIVSAGAFGREVLSWALDVPAGQRDWEIAGFLDNRPSVLDGFDSPFSIMGDPLTFEISENDCFICAVGDPATKLHYSRQLKARGGQFISLIHPTAVIGLNCSLGEGCILCPYTIVTTNVTLGNFVTLNLHATVGHDVVIGDGCTLSCHSDVTGGVTLGQGVFLGSHASVLPKANVGEYALVGAGSVVLRQVLPHTTVMGVPAKQVYGFKNRSNNLHHEEKC